jgi:hypothetical protein
MREPTPAVRELADQPGRAGPLTRRGTRVHFARIIVRAKHGRQPTRQPPPQLSIRMICTMMVCICDIQLPSDCLRTSIGQLLAAFASGIDRGARFRELGLASVADRVVYGRASSLGDDGPGSFQGTPSTLLSGHYHSVARDTAPVGAPARSRASRRHGHGAPGSRGAADRSAVLS